ncbi:hypothetical protein PV325_001551 [Microctonus aethiopoides]|uniref:EF-hand domain-containing protein n=1 Tax=Microctonus aethiopoides TaxID=144406 RepID=A0AA39FP62_9HYME|nr:hypothetical protein PV325_001551 [Microctonus aethiopoides]KAK0173249.1 hypothetical protein PV328_006477 [Microctonus aethiopoides]
MSRGCRSRGFIQRYLREILSPRNHYAHYVFKAFDVNCSGAISFRDLLVTLSTLLRGSIYEKLRWTFKLYDINGDGCITRGELGEVVNAVHDLMGQKHPAEEERKAREQLDRVFEKLDLNHDGVITIEEFIESCLKDEVITRSLAMFDWTTYSRQSLTSSSPTPPFYSILPSISDPIPKHPLPLIPSSPSLSSSSSLSSPASTIAMSPISPETSEILQSPSSQYNNNFQVQQCYRSIINPWCNSNAQIGVMIEQRSTTSPDFLPTMMKNKLLNKLTEII